MKNLYDNLYHNLRANLGPNYHNLNPHNNLYWPLHTNPWANLYGNLYHNLRDNLSWPLSDSLRS